MKEMNTRLVVLASVIATVLCLAPSSASAYDYDGYRWYGNPTFLVASNMGAAISCNEFSVISWRNEVTCAAKGWNLVGSTYITFYIGTNDENDTDKYDTENEVAWDSGLASTTLGNEWTNHIGGTIYESDITFNPNPSFGTWVAGAPPPSAWHYNQANMIAFRAIALHEFGHALGLGHEYDEQAVMNSSYPSGGWYRGEPQINGSGQYTGYYGRFWPHADDIQGAYVAYPNTTQTGRDLAFVRAKKQLGSSTQDLDEVVSFLSAGNEGRVCAKGSNVNSKLEIEYTVENRGNETLSNVKVNAYLSTDIWIDPANDIKLSNTYTYSLNPHRWLHRGSNTFYVPVGTTPRNYYVGIYVDADNDYPSEASSWNNGAHLRVMGSAVDTLEVLDTGNGLCN